MKALLTVLLGIFAGALLLTVCPAHAQTLSQFLGPDGEKKFGQYVWVWHTEIPPEKKVSVEARCPEGYVVLGGAYETTTGAVGVISSHPSADFNGWVVVTGGGSGYGGRITVYASCAPES